MGSVTVLPPSEGEAGDRHGQGLVPPAPHCRPPNSAVGCGTLSWQGWGTRAGDRVSCSPDPVPVPAQLCL